MNTKEKLQKIYLGDDWWNLDPLWERLEKLGQQRDSQKLEYKSTKNWSSLSTHFLGLLGEMTFSLETGYRLDEILHIGGDPGFDFNINGLLYNVKATKYWHDPHLKEYLKPKKWVDRYVLVGINIDARKAKVFGWASKEQMMAAKKVDYNYGDQLSLSHLEINQGLPNDIRSLRKELAVTEPTLIGAHHD